MNIEKLKTRIDLIESKIESLQPKLMEIYNSVEQIRKSNLTDEEKTTRIKEICSKDMFSSLRSIIVELLNKELPLKTSYSKAKFDCFFTKYKKGTQEPYYTNDFDTDNRLNSGVIFQVLANFERSVIKTDEDLRVLIKGYNYLLWTFIRDNTTLKDGEIIRFVPYMIKLQNVGYRINKYIDEIFNVVRDCIFNYRCVKIITISNKDFELIMNNTKSKKGLEREDIEIVIDDFFDEFGEYPTVPVLFKRYEEYYDLYDTLDLDVIHKYEIEYKNFYVYINRFRLQDKVKMIQVKTRGKSKGGNNE